jgi:adenine-specific DNA methylase
MRWSEIRASHPEQWLVIEALEARSEGGRRILDRIAVVEVCADGAAAMQRYRELHRQHGLRELYFAHTRNEELSIDERPWVGVRWSDASRPA